MVGLSRSKSARVGYVGAWRQSGARRVRFEFRTRAINLSSRGLRQERPIVPSRPRSARVVSGAMPIRWTMIFNATTAQIFEKGNFEFGFPAKARGVPYGPGLVKNAPTRKRPRRVLDYCCLLQGRRSGQRLSSPAAPDAKCRKPCRRNSCRTADYAPRRAPGSGRLWARWKTCKKASSTGQSAEGPLMQARRRLRRKVGGQVERRKGRTMWGY